jgi:DNA-binding transcriptional MocR family regulator
MSQSVLERFRPVLKGDGPAVLDQIDSQIRTLIEIGALRDGDRLPTTRELSAQMEVNRGVLLKAIRRLESAGVLKSRVGSGILVSGRAPDRLTELPWELKFSEAISRVTVAENSSGREEAVFVDFSRLAPDERFFPLDDFVKVLSETSRRQRDLWQYSSPYGLPDLRRQIALRTTRTGAPWGAEDILVTTGAQQGLDLLFKTFVDPGDAVAVESPTYPGIVPLLRFYGAEIIEIPVIDGVRNLDSLARRNVRIVYTMPDRHNPTGTTMGAEARRQLLGASLASGAIVVEDGYERSTSGEPPLCAMERRRVVNVGSFSKDLVPGFRLGWIAADRPILRALALAKQTTDLHTPLPLQAATAEFLRTRADEVVKTRRAVEIESRRKEMADSLVRQLPKLAYSGGGAGNSLFWIELPLGMSGREVARRSLARGVRVAPGADFDPFGRDLSAIRLSVSRVDAAAIPEGVARLSRAVSETQAKSGGALAIPSI